MAESEGIKGILNKVAIQVTTAVMMAFRNMDAGTQPTTTANYRELQRQMCSRPIVEKPLFNWDAKDRYVELVTFDMEVMSILQTRAYELTDEEKVPVIKKLARSGESTAYKDIHPWREWEMQNHERLLLSLEQQIQAVTQ